MMISCWTLRLLVPTSAGSSNAADHSLGLLHGSWSLMLSPCRLPPASRHMGSFKWWQQHGPDKLVPCLQDRGAAPERGKVLCGTTAGTHIAYPHQLVLASHGLPCICHALPRVSRLQL